MEEKENERIAVSDLTSMLLREGYRNKFSVSSTGSSGPLITDKLSKCLEHFLQGGRADNTAEFELRTCPPYSDHLECLFQLKFDQLKGFLIKELTIKDRVSQESRYYRITNNQQVPGAMSVQGLFPKPKPWDDHLKGRFRI